MNAARVVACALVVLVHADMHLRADIPTWWPGGTAFAPVFAIAVPTFMLLAGYFARPEGLGRRLRRLVPPFLFWNAVLLTLGAEGEGLPPGETARLALTGAWQLYFLFALLQLHAIDALTARWPRPAFALAMFASVAAYALSEAALARGHGFAFEVELRRAGPAWAAFFAIGALLRRGEGASARLVAAWPWLLLAAAAVYPLAVSGYDANNDRFGHDPRHQFLLTGLAFQVLGTLAFVAVMARIDRRATASPAARDTFGIYLGHTAVMVLLYRAMQARGWTWVGGSEVAVVTAATWLLTWLLVRLARRAPAPVRRVALGE